MSDGKSKTFTFQVKWSDDLFKNKYEWLERFKGDFHYWKFIELLQAIKILHLVDSKNIEKIVKKDKSRLVLLNMLSWHLGITPTDKLIEWLLNDPDELNQNIGFCFITRKFSSAVSDILYYQNIQKSSENYCHPKYNKEEKRRYRENLNLIKVEIPKIEQFLIKCDDKTKVSLLVNYILVQREGHPVIFARWLIEVDNQEHLIDEIKNIGKLRTLRDVLALLSVISKTKRSKGETENAPKLPLYNAIVDTLMTFVKNRSGLYKWEEQEQNEFLDICVMLPKQSKKKLSRFLRQELEMLAVSDIDRLLRYKIYLEDERKLQIINGMLNILNG